MIRRTIALVALLAALTGCQRAAYCVDRAAPAAPTCVVAP